MTSIPAPDLNNLKFSKARAEEFGYLRIANTCLLSVLSVALLAIAGMGWEIHKLDKTIADFKPVYVRINDVGKAEVVYYKDASYQPRSPEIIRALSDFTNDYFTRMKGRVDSYWHAKYLLSDPLSQSGFADDQKTQWIRKVQLGQGVQNDVTVDRVTLVSLTPSGGLAYVDFTRRYFQGGAVSDKKETDTATYYFSFLPKLEGPMLRWNPLGICITNLSVQENFSQ
jgi:type IV secretory pathway TrbF-like protein